MTYKIEILNADGSVGQTIAKVFNSLKAVMKASNNMNFAHRIVVYQVFSTITVARSNKKVA